MAATPNSSSASYLPAAEFVKRCDWRTIADLVSDTGARAYQSASALASDVNLAAALMDASGVLESACLAGHRYEAADLAALTAAPCAGQALVYRLVSDIAVSLLAHRRPDKKLPVPPTFEWTMRQLDLLRSGERIFPFRESQDAGVSEDYVEQPADVIARNMTTRQSRRYFGRRANMNPLE